MVKFCARPAAAAMALLLLLPCAAVAGDPSQVAMQMHIQNEALHAINYGDDDALEKMSETLLQDKSQMPDGYWQLDCFYDTLGTFMIPQYRDQQLKIWQTTYAKWIAAYPKSRTAPIADAYVHFVIAWQDRGSGYANEVWKDAWAGFDLNMKEAQKILAASKAATGSNPRWYALMIAVKGALGAGPVKLLPLADEGLKTEPMNYSIATSMMTFLQPQWGGSPDLMEAWAKKAVELTRSTDGESLYARLYWTAEDSSRIERFRTYKIDWARFKKATDDLLERYPSTGNIERALKMACVSMDADEVNKRYASLAKLAGPALRPSIVPTEYCRWPKTAGPGVITPEQFLKDSEPKKVRVN